MAVVVDLANAVVATINGASLPPPQAALPRVRARIAGGNLPARGLGSTVAAIRRYVKTAERVNVDGIAVVVIPVGFEVHAFDLTPRHSYDWDIAVWVEQRVDPQGLTDIDPLMQLIEDLIALFEGKPLAGTNARCIGVNGKLVDDHGLITTAGIYAEVITFRFRMTK